MNNFQFHSPTEFEFGRGAEAQAGRLVRKYGGARVLVVYGGGSVVRSGLLGRVRQSLAAEGLASVELGGVRPNPTDGLVREGMALGRREGIDFILAVGGGSVIDTAKAIAAGLCYEGDFWDFYIGKATVREALPVGVVLTIPAAGSEGSGNSVITNERTMQKISLRTPEALRPRFALMNPELTFTLPAWQTACGITDMMAHIMERYFNNTPHTEITDRLSEGLLRGIIEVAPRVMEQPDDYEARANIMWAGTVAHNGICGTGVQEDWVSHFMEHEISALYDVSHGAGLAVVFPAWLTFMASHNVHKVKQYAVRVWGVADTGDDKAVALEGIARLKAFLHAIGMPTTFAGLGVERPDIDALVRNLHVTKGAVIGGYHKLDASATREIYELAL